VKEFEVKWMNSVPPNEPTVMTIAAMAPLAPLLVGF
jgi:hypothetical protein